MLLDAVCIQLQMCRGRSKILVEYIGFQTVHLEQRSWFSGLHFCYTLGGWGHGSNLRGDNPLAHLPYSQVLTLDKRVKPPGTCTVLLVRCAMVTFKPRLDHLGVLHCMCTGLYRPWLVFIYTRNGVLRTLFYMCSACLHHLPCDCLTFRCATICLQIITVNNEIVKTSSVSVTSVN